ncbi:hypothetical protein EAH74_30015 [Pseudomonas mandelii]|uniref:Uncharacterized protein n=1 Tax=Pseudomonas mandelii TaxID=75612 RepID=A0A502HQJ4_9PSED|nr:hypothetical protein EAH74_30015 [Pseudomonas mandelii]
MNCQHNPPVGASLLAKAVVHSTSMLNVMASSRAGSLPHWIVVSKRVITHPAARCTPPKRCTAFCTADAQPYCRSAGPCRDGLSGP